MFFKTAYAAAKLGLKEGDMLTRKAYSEQDRAGYTPTEGLEMIVPDKEMEERDWIVVPAKQTAKARYGLADGSGLRSSTLVPSSLDAGIRINGLLLVADHAI